MKKAIQIGGGNIGRGFIGAVLSGAGYHVVFADINQELLDRINADGTYTVHVVDVHSKDIPITDISAVSSSDIDAMVKEILEAEIITTAVGLRVLPYVAPAIAAGISARRSAGNDSPINIIACENGIRATSELRRAVYERLSEEESAWADGHVGFPDCSVDRIVPPVRSENPIDVAVEEFYEWNVEKKSLVGEPPAIDGMNLVDDLSAYIERKLFTLNTGHAVTAYLGAMKGYDTIDESIADLQIFTIVKGAMVQSGDALVRKFGLDPVRHREYIDHIIERFRNPYLKDDVMRVGREPMRKLSASDRLIKPLMTAAQYGLPYDCLLLGVGAALHFDNPDDVQSFEMRELIGRDGLERAVSNISSIPGDSPLLNEIVLAYTKVENIINNLI